MVCLTCLGQIHVITLVQCSYIWLAEGPCWLSCLINEKSDKPLSNKRACIYCNSCSESKLCCHFEKRWNHLNCIESCQPLQLIQHFFSDRIMFIPISLDSCIADNLLKRSQNPTFKLTYASSHLHEI